MATDIFAECSIDYDKNSEITHQFYAMIQKNSIMQLREIQRQKLYIKRQTIPRKIWD